MTLGLITMATEEIVSPVIGLVPPAQVGSHTIDYKYFYYVWQHVLHFNQQKL